MQGQPYSSAYRYARTCAFVNFVYVQENTIFEHSKGRIQRLHLRSLHANVQALLEATDLSRKSKQACINFSFSIAPSIDI